MPRGVTKCDEGASLKDVKTVKSHILQGGSFHIPQLYSYDHKHLDQNIA